MALVLGFRVGESFSVGSDQLTLSSFDGVRKAILRRADGTSTAVHMNRRTEILPNVFVFLSSVLGDNVLKLGFEAPDEILILRLGEN